MLLIFTYKLNNKIFLYYNLKNYILNTTLINGVILIHPFYVYCTYIFMLLLYIFFKPNIIKKNLIYYFVNKQKNVYLKISFFALLLGSL